MAPALFTAVNHRGDSDSTGAIVGNLLGVAWGDAARPADLVAGLDPDERRLVAVTADDLWQLLHTATPDGADDLDRRYPPS